MIAVSTTMYEWSHGKKPRGFGCWIFQIGKCPIQYQPKEAMNYSEAIAEARLVAKASGARFIVVMP